MSKAFVGSYTRTYKQRLILGGGFGSIPDEAWTIGNGSGTTASTLLSKATFWNGADFKDPNFPLNMNGVPILSARNLTITTGSIASSLPAINITQTWPTIYAGGSTSYSLIYGRATVPVDVGGNPQAYGTLLDLGINSTSVFSLDVYGNTYVTGQLSVASIYTADAFQIGFNVNSSDSPFLITDVSYGDAIGVQAGQIQLYQPVTISGGLYNGGDSNLNGNVYVSGQLNVTGSSVFANGFTVSGGTQFNDNATFGDASTDTYTFAGRAVFRALATAPSGTSPAGTAREIAFYSSTPYYYGASGWSAISQGAAGSTTQLQYNNAGSLAGTAGMTWDATNQSLTVASASQTSSSAVGPLILSQTWNTTGTPTAFSLSITNTSSNAASLLMNLRSGTAGTTSVFAVTASGVATIVPATAIASTSTDGLVLTSGGSADSSTTARNSARIRLSGSAYRAIVSPATQSHDWTIENVPSGATAADSTSKISFKYSFNGGAYSIPFSVSGTGSLSTTGNITAGGSYTGTSIGLSSGIFANASINAQVNGIQTTSTDGFSCTNNVFATSILPVQYSPRVRMTGNVWNTTSSASNSTNWVIENRPLSSATPVGVFTFAHDLNGAGYITAATLTSGGTLDAVVLSQSGSTLSSILSSYLTTSSASATYATIAAPTLTGVVTLSGGDVRLTNGTSNRIYFGGIGTAIPGAASLGQKVQLSGTAGTVGSGDYALGVESGNMWFNTGTSGGYKWYSNATVIGSLSSAGVLTVGSITLTTSLSIANGGTGATSQAGAANNVLPTQTSQSGKYLTTDGTNVSWATVTGGGGTPAGSSTELQYRNGSSFGATTGMNWTAATQSLVHAGLALTGSSASTPLSITHTWNTTGTPTAFSVSVTNTASNAASLLMNLLGGSAGTTSMFSVDITGNVLTAGATLKGSSSSNFTVSSGSPATGNAYGVVLAGATAISNGNGGSVNITAGSGNTASSTSYNGGNITLTTGGGTGGSAGSAGSFSFLGGNASGGGGAGAGFTFTATAGSGAGVGGGMAITLGGSSGGVAGSYSLVAGSSPAGAGSISLTAGSSAGSAGGNVTISSGDGGGTGGNVNLTASPNGTGGGGSLNFTATGTSAVINLNGTAVTIGSGALTTTATTGFFYLNSTTGTPTGTPTSISGRIPFVYDSTNNRLYAYNSSWQNLTSGGTATTPGGSTTQMQYNNAGVFGGTAGMTWTASTQSIVHAGLALSGSAVSTPLSITHTWNTTGTPTAFSVAVTNTASNAASMLMNLLAGTAATTSMFAVSATGVVTAAGNITSAAGISGTTGTFSSIISAASATLSGGSLSMTNGTSNRVYFGTNGVAVPGASSAGMKINLYGTAGAVAASDYGIGIESGYLWMNVASTAGYKWYVNSTQVASMTATGGMLLGTTTDDGVSKLQVNGLVTVAGTVIAKHFRASAGTVTVSSSAATPLATDYEINAISADAGSLTSNTITVALPTASSPFDGQRLLIRIKNTNSGSTGMTVSLNSSYHLGAYTLTAIAAGKTDLFGLMYNGTDSVWMLVAYAKGY